MLFCFYVSPLPKEGIGAIFPTRICPGCQRRAGAGRDRGGPSNPPPIPHTPRWFPPVVSAAEGGRSRQRGPRGRRAQRAGRTGRCQLPRPGRGSAGRASSQPAETVLVRSRQPPRCPPPAPHFSAPRTWLSKGLCGRNSLGSVTQVPQETGRRQSCACRGALDDPCGGGR